MLNDFKRKERTDAMDQLLKLRQLLQSLGVTISSVCTIEDLATRIKSADSYPDEASSEWLRKFVKTNTEFGSAQYYTEKELIKKGQISYTLLVKSELFDIAEDIITEMFYLQARFVEYLDSLNFESNQFGYYLKRNMLGGSYKEIYQNFIHCISFDNSLNTFNNFTTRARKVYPSEITISGVHPQFSHVNSRYINFAENNLLIITMLNLRCNEQSLQFTDRIFGNLVNDLRRFGTDDEVARGVSWPYTIASSSRALIQLNNQEVTFNTVNEPIIQDNPAIGIFNYACLLSLISGNLSSEAGDHNVIEFQNGKMTTSEVQALGLIRSSKGINKRFIGEGNFELCIRYID